MWSLEWNVDKADIDTLSRSPIMSLMPSKQGTKYPWRQTTEASTASMPNRLALPHSIPPQYMAYLYPFYSYPGLQQFTQLQSRLPSPLL